MPNVAFKIPRNVVKQHPELAARHWDAGDQVALSDLVSGAPANIILEAVSVYGRIVIRSADAGSMIRMRRYSDSLGHDFVNADDVTAVLEARNPNREMRVDE